MHCYLDTFNQHTWAPLPGLDTNVRLPGGDRFRYDGPVSDLARNIAETEAGLRAIGTLVQEHRSFFDRCLDGFLIRCAVARVKEQLRDFATTLAYCYEHRISGHARVYVIARRADLPPEMALFADGHESGELLLKLQQQAVLGQALADAGVTGVDVQSYTGEDFCDVGGLLALHKARIAGIHVDFPSFRKPRPVVESLRGKFAT